MNKLLLISFLFAFNLKAAEIKPIDEKYANNIVNAIGKAENSVKYPYGIKSINTHGDKELARRICLKTVQNQYIRWQQWGKTNSFIDSLADRYCPPSADKQGNLNWKKNVKFFLKKND